MVSFFNALTFLTVGIPVAVITVAYRKLNPPPPGPTFGTAASPASPANDT